MKSLGILVVLVTAGGPLFYLPQTAVAETMSSALAHAYTTNPELNRERANVRVQDEDVARAWSGLRPAANIQGFAGPQYTDIKLPVPNIRSPFTGWSIVPENPLNGQRFALQQGYSAWPRGATFNVSQPIFDGGRTTNAVGEAEAGTFAARALAGLSEEITLQTGANAYMNVLRDSAILSLRKNHLAVLELQLSNTRQQFHAGDVTTTDVAQAEAALAQARSEYFGAQAQLKSSVGDYHRIVGIDPKRLEPAASVEHMLPKSVEGAIAVACNEHPSVVAAMHQVDAAEFAVNVAMSALAPTLSLDGQVTQQYDTLFGYPGSRQFAAGARVSLNVPLYQRGEEYASVRQSKEKLGRARLDVDVQRAKARSNVISSYARLQAIKAQINSDQAAVKAAEKALNGVRQESQVGQRTTLDVLNAQQTLLNARVNLIISQSDRVVASYAALAAIGRLSAESLNLDVLPYDPTIHFEQVKFKFIGLDADAR